MKKLSMSKINGAIEKKPCLPIRNLFKLLLKTLSLILINNSFQKLHLKTTID